MRKPFCFGIIPARYASTRFPGKPLALIDGMPMFWHVYRRAKACPLLLDVALATDDERIAEKAAELAVSFVITSPQHQSGTDRVYEAAWKLGLPKHFVVANIQGDEPLLEPAMLRDLLLPFYNDEAVQVSTLGHPISDEEALNENRVKIAMGLDGNALYFSRAPIPHIRNRVETDNPDDLSNSFLGHIGLYAFKMETLIQFVKLKPSPLELREGLEQLRFLENGIPVHVALTKHLSQAVDTPEDLKRVEELLLA